MNSLATLRRSLLALSACSTLLAGPDVVLDDTFDNCLPGGTAAIPDLWRLQAITGDNGVFETGGNLTLFATTHPYTFAGMNTVLDRRLNFFDHAITVSVEGLSLEHKGIPDNESVFRVSLNSTELRQNLSPQSVSVRFVPGLAILGFKTAPVDKMAAEELQGMAKGSACFEPFDGRLTGFSLTLDPLPAPGHVTYTLVLFTEGTRPVVTRTGLLALAATDWNADGTSALVMEARRNSATTAPDTYMSATLGRITVTTR